MVTEHNGSRVFNNATDAKEAKREMDESNLQIVQISEFNY